MLYQVEIHCFIHANNEDDANDKMEKALKDNGFGHCPLVYKTNQKPDEIRFENMGATPFPLLTCKCGNEFPNENGQTQCYACYDEERNTKLAEILAHMQEIE